MGAKRKKRPTAFSRRERHSSEFSEVRCVLLLVDGGEVIAAAFKDDDGAGVAGDFTEGVGVAGKAEDEGAAAAADTVVFGGTPTR